MDTKRIIPDLALYHYKGCPHSDRVRQALEDLDLSIEERDIHRHPPFSDELSEGTGKTTVPVLRIDRVDGTVTWLSESEEIIAYLKKRFGSSER
jgi:glutathione S-transferase